MEVVSQVVIEAKLVDTSSDYFRKLDHQGFRHVADFLSYIPRQVVQPGGMPLYSVGTIAVPPPAHQAPNEDTLIAISPKVFDQFDHPALREALLARALTNVLRDLPLTASPSVSAGRSLIQLNLLPQAPTFHPWSVDLFGIAAFGQVGGTERVTRTVTTKETRIVDVPTKVLVPFDDGFKIVDREELRLIPTKDINHRTRTLTERRDINRLGDFAGGGGLGVNFKFNPRFGVSLRGEVFGGRDTLGLISASVFGDYDCCWPVIPTYSLGGGVLLPCAEPVIDVGLGLKKHLTPSSESSPSPTTSATSAASTSARSMSAPASASAPPPKPPPTTASPPPPNPSPSHPAASPSRPKSSAKTPAPPPSAAPSSSSPPGSSMASGNSPPTNSTPACAAGRATVGEAASFPYSHRRAILRA